MEIVNLHLRVPAEVTPGGCLAIISFSWGSQHFPGLHHHRPTVAARAPGLGTAQSSPPGPTAGWSPGDIHPLQGISDPKAQGCRELVRGSRRNKALPKPHQSLVKTATLEADKELGTQ